MIHPKVIDARREQLNAALKDVLPPGGLREYPVETVREFVDYRLPQAFDPKDRRKQIRPFSKEEQIFIRNEQIMGKISFPYWGERYWQINFQGQAIAPLYPLWESQRLILQHVGAIEWDRYQSGHPDGVIYLVLKARQLGASTLSEAIIGHRTTCYAHVFGLIASDEQDASSFLFDMYERGVERLPFFMRPTVTEHVKNDEMVFATGSHTFVGWSRAQRKGSDGVGKRGQIGRGKTLSVLHLSELASWEQPEQIDEALMPAVPMTPLTFGALESTAKGRFNWWHKNWMAAKAGKSRYSAVFIPWYAERGKYWLPAPVDWTPNLTTLAHARRATEYGPRWMHSTVQLTREQLYWYEFNRAQNEAAGKLSSFLEEYPSDDEEAFQHSGRSIFTLQVRERIRDKAKSLVGVVEVESFRELTRMGK
jgi:hypothetical protein